MNPRMLLNPKEKNTKVQKIWEKGCFRPGAWPLWVWGGVSR